MIWREVTIRTAVEAVEMLANFLQELGCGGVVIEEADSRNRPRDSSLGQWYELPPSGLPKGEAAVQAYFSEEENIGEIIGKLERFIREIRDYPTDVGEGRIIVRDVKEEDWANGWKTYFKPVRVTERLTIKPTWEDYRPQPEEIVLELDPGMAFGTGTHATTSLCLKALERYVEPGMDVIDVGTGSGVLAIAAAKLGARRVLALDLDPVAVSSAAENVRVNGLTDRVEVVRSDLLQALRERQNGGKAGGRGGIRPPVGLVVANILAEIILVFVNDVYEALAPGGVYIASGIIDRKERQVREALAVAGFAVKQVEADQDWTALVAVKPHGNSRLART